jgi:hypothetical protein
MRLVSPHSIFDDEFRPTLLFVLMWLISAATPSIAVRPLVPVPLTANLYTGCEADIVECQLGNAGVKLEQQRQWLTDATGCAEDCHLGGLCSN